MIKHEKSIRYKFLACLLAVTLVFGLSALPAFAVPDASSGEQPSAQSEKETTEDAVVVEHPTQQKPVIEKPASENTPKAPSNNSWTAGTTGTEVAENGTAEGSGSSNPLETFGAVLQAEGELAVENAAGIKAQSYDEGDLDSPYNTYDEYTAKVKKRDFGSYSPSTWDDGKLTITKVFSPAPTIATTETDGKINTPSIAVQFKLVGEQMDYRDRFVYKNESKNYCLMLTKDGSVEDWNGHTMYLDANGGLLVLDEEGNYWDTDNKGGEFRGCIYKKDGKLVSVNGGGYVYCDLYVDEDDDFKYYYFNDDNEAVYIDADGVLSGSINDWRVLFTYTDPTSFTVGTVDNLGLEPITWTIPVSVEVGADVATRTIDGLPTPARYTISEVVYPGCGYNEGRPDISATFEFDDFFDSDNVYTITFTNMGTEDGVPSSGITNAYKYDSVAGELKGKTLENNGYNASSSN